MYGVKSWNYLIDDRQKCKNEHLLKIKIKRKSNKNIEIFNCVTKVGEGNISPLLQPPFLFC